MNRVQRVISNLSKEHGISARELLGDSRKSEVVALRRAVAIRLIDMKMTYSAVGRALNRDRRAICHLVSGSGA